MEYGTVKWYNDSKAQGVINALVSGYSVYVSAEDIVDAQYLCEHQFVSFYTDTDSMGTRIARNVKIIPVKETVLCEVPRISVFENVIPPEYCKSLVNYYNQAGMNPNSGYVSREQASGQVTELVEQRGISNGMLPVHVNYLADLIHNTIRLPYSHIEAIDIYNYEVGQYLDLHHDYPYDPTLIPYYKNGGDRVGTGIFWLNTDYEGGDTYFPQLDVNVKPTLGGFLYFEQGYDEATNWKTIHESTLITKGTKWISACFFANQPRVK